MTATRNWIAHFNGRGEVHAINMRDIPSDELGELQSAVARRLGGGEDDYAELIDITRCEVACSVPYEWGLAGPDGAYFVLIRIPGTSDEQIAEAKEYLRATRDVVRLSVLTLTELSGRLNNNL